MPYGVYDVAHNIGWVNVGISHDTADFAVESIRRWWLRWGQELYPGASRLLITGDGDGQVGEQGLREQAPGQEAGAGKERNDAGHEEEGSQVRVGKVEGFEIGHLMVLGDRRARGMLFFGVLPLSRMTENLNLWVNGQNPMAGLVPLLG